MTTNIRVSSHPIDPLFLERWSPRAFDSSQLADADLATIFEAARWAPSSYNSQPWQFLYAKRGDAHWELFLSLLIPFNASWVKHASVLIYIVSDSMMTLPSGELQPSYSRSFDAGAAWALLALQATRLGLQAHGMVGVDFPRAQQSLEVPERFRIEAAVAIGRQADKSILPKQLQAREMPSDRKPLEQIIRRGLFKA